MKTIGMLLFGGGFLAGAFFLVQRLDEVAWVPFGISGAVCVAGVVLMRWAERSDESTRRAAAADMEVLRATLARLLDNLEDIYRRREAIGVYGIHGQIDDVLLEDLDTFAAAREAVIHQHGLSRYAEVMDAFAAGERSLNRAWSASADGYIDEVWICLERAQRAFSRAQHALVHDEAPAAV